MYNAELSANSKFNGNEDIFPTKKKTIIFNLLKSDLFFPLQQFFQL